MYVHVDQSFHDLGISSIVIGVAHNVDPHAGLSEELEEEIREQEKRCLDMDPSVIGTDPITEGYRQLTARSGRSVKKNPPTVPALINNIRHRGSMPRINTIVDLYNVESLESCLAVGGHDLDKITSPLTFTVSGKEDTFTPIGANPKHVAETDFLYRDAKGIIAWLGTRDSEFYKFDDNTRNAIFIIAGNAVTTIQERTQAMEHIRERMSKCMPGMTFEIYSVSDEAEID